jgi:hypothetical protein
VSPPGAKADFELLAKAAECIRHEFEDSTESWAGSPFEWITNLPAGSKGKLGKRLIYQWAALSGLSVDRCPDTEADMLINGHRIEVKFSTLWKGGYYKFQQIRDQSYEYSVCLGISPFNVHCWVISKVILKELVIGHLGQHTGSGGKDTAWISVDPRNPPDWLKPFGGSLDVAFAALKTIKRI